MERRRKRREEHCEFVETNESLTPLSFSFSRKHTEGWNIGIADFDKIWRERSFSKKYSTRIFFLSAVIDVEGVKTTLNVGSAYFAKYLKIIEDN